MPSILHLAQQYAARQGTTLLAHRLHDTDQITIILESGPKLTLTAAELNESLPTLEPAPTTVIDTTDGVNDTEASLAGQALSKRRKRSPRKVAPA